MSASGGCGRGERGNRGEGHRREIREEIELERHVLRGEADQFAACLQFDLGEGLQGSTDGDGPRACSGRSCSVDHRLDVVAVRIKDKGTLADVLNHDVFPRAPACLNLPFDQGALDIGDRLRRV